MFKNWGVQSLWCSKLRVKVESRIQSLVVAPACLDIVSLAIVKLLLFDVDLMPRSLEAFGLAFGRHRRTNGNDFGTPLNGLAAHPHLNRHTV
jgi:hypothetical protein